MSSAKNTISSVSNQILTFNANVVQILTALNQAVSSDAATASVTVTNNDGTTTTIQFPTVGSLQAQINVLNNNIQTLAGINAAPSVVQLANNVYKRIILSDLNVEPNDLTSLGVVNTFQTNPNWIIDSMLNPALTVQLDLTGMIQDDVRKIDCRRFIVEFETDATGVLTSNGQARLADFTTNYKGQSNINMVSFVSWLGSAGLKNQANPLLDEKVLDLDPHRLQYNGYFTVLRVDTDTLNQIQWYVLDTINYQDVSNTSAPPVTKTLAPGDQVTVVSNTTNVSSTVYQVVQVSTATSELRVQFQLQQGFEPIPVRVAALEIYSPLVLDKLVDIPIGFNEYNVIFVKPLNASNNVLAKNWSQGVGFYTNELTLQSTAGSTLSNYYYQFVSDYGAVLQDLVAKIIPTVQGVTPAAPVLDVNNFTVTQTNLYLTNTPDVAQLTSLHNTKTNTKSQLAQIQTAISAQTKLIATTTFSSDADLATANQTLATLSNTASATSARLTSVVNTITAAQTPTITVAPEFAVRGFWPIPVPVNVGSTTQSVIQFEVQYRKYNVSGSTQPIQTFPDVGGQNAVYSSWVSYKTDIAQRSYNSDTGVWSWIPENLSDSDVPNINQLDIPLQPNEAVDIRIKSLSEVGWPDAPLVSEFSNVITIAFPTSLLATPNGTTAIVSSAQQDATLINMQSSLGAAGLYTHIGQSTQIANQYYGHNANQILSGILDSSGNPMSEYAVIQSLLARITILENQILLANGELTVSLNNGNTVIPIVNNSVNNYTIELENSLTPAIMGTVSNPITPPARSYANNVTILKNFVLNISNASNSNPLSLLSNRNYSPATTDSSFAVQQASSAAQAVWVDQNNNALLNINLNGSGNITSVNSQSDNQFVWLKNLGQSGSPIYYTSPTTLNNYDYTSIQYVHEGIRWQSPSPSTVGNFGIPGPGVSPTYGGTTPLSSANISTNSVFGNNGITNITNSVYWSIYEGVYYNGAASPADSAVGEFACTMAPQIPSFNTVVEAGSAKLKNITPGTVLSIPLLGYYKLSTVAELFDQKTISSWYTTAGTTATPRADNQKVLQVLMNYLNVLGVSYISNTPTANIYWNGNGTGYTPGSSSALLTVAVTGSGSNLKVDTISAQFNTQSSYTVGVGTITVHSGNAGTSYAIGDVFTITQGGNNAYGIVTKINTSTGAVLNAVPVTLYTLYLMGLNTGDFLVINNTSGMTQINNKLLPILSFNGINSTVIPYITVNVNSNSWGVYTTSPSISTIVTLTKVNLAYNQGVQDVQIWNSISIDNNLNAPITPSLVVINSTSQSPKIIERSLSFYIEPQNTLSAFQFVLNFSYKQYKSVTVIDSIIQSTSTNNIVTSG